MNLNDSGPRLIDEASVLHAELAEVLERIASLTGEAEMITSIFRATARRAASAH